MTGAGSYAKTGKRIVARFRRTSTLWVAPATRQVGSNSNDWA